MTPPVLTSTEHVSVQRLTESDYRVNARGGRSAITGRYRSCRCAGHGCSACGGER